MTAERLASGTGARAPEELILVPGLRSSASHKERLETGDDGKERLETGDDGILGECDKRILIGHCVVTWSRIGRIGASSASRLHATSNALTFEAAGARAGAPRLNLSEDYAKRARARRSSVSIAPATPAEIGRPRSRSIKALPANPAAARRLKHRAPDLSPTPRDNARSQNINIAYQTKHACTNQRTLSNRPLQGETRPTLKPDSRS